MSAIFDFDKTLTFRDTFIPIISRTEPKIIVRLYKRIVAYFFQAFYKFHLISNLGLKNRLVKLYLNGKNIEDLKMAAYTFKEYVAFTHLLDLVEDDDLISTASLRVVVEILLEDRNVIVDGSELLLQDGLILGLKRNNYGIKKQEYFKINFRKLYSAVYSDSLTDLSLLDFAKVFYLVRGGSIIRTFQHEESL